MIQFNKGPGEKVLELGGGMNRNPVSDVSIDVREGPGVDFAVDFNKPDWPIQSDEWNSVISIFALEHISWRCIPVAFREILRILKPGGKLVAVVPNTEAQIRWILAKGWLEFKTRKHDGEFVESSRILFGDLDYPENSHRVFYSPSIMTSLLSEAGFERITIQSYGEIGTDMVVEAVKPLPPPPETPVEASKTLPEASAVRNPAPSPPPLVSPVLTGQGKEAAAVPNVLGSNVARTVPREKRFGFDYFDNYRSQGFYWDYPFHEVILQNVLARKPSSVLELGCGRGYILKRLQDRGIVSAGFDVSKHCFLTRACDNLITKDVCETPWDAKDFDLCLSICLLEHLEEGELPKVFEEMSRSCKRGLHAITFEGLDDGMDRTRITLKPKEWWQKHLPENHEVLTYNEIRFGEFPKEVLEGDGKVKLNLGCYMTQFHHGWVNLDYHEHLHQFAQANGYKYQVWKAPAGLPFGTETVDLIYTSHMLEHLSYADGKALLRECRRVLKPDGNLRAIVPDACLLMNMYTSGHGELDQFDEINKGCAGSPTAAGKLWSLLHDNHLSCYDPVTLGKSLEETGFNWGVQKFREGHLQTLRETLDSLPCLSLYVDAKPRI